VTEAEWLACTEPERMLEFLRGKASDRKLRLFAVACCRRIWQHIEDDCRRFIETAELFADGKADSQSLARCRDEAFVLMCELTCNSGSVPWLVTVNHPMPEGPAGFRGPATIWEAAVDTAQAAAAAVGDEYFVFHPVPAGADYASLRPRVEAEVRAEQQRQSALLRCIVGPFPFRQPSISPRVRAWSGEAVFKMAEAIYDQRELPAGTLDATRLAVVADALEEAGCTDPDLLAYFRGPGPHYRGCWAVDLLLGKG
jgi:hypothetical protein